MSPEPSLLLGMALVCTGGFVDGSLGLALKYPKLWKWEHLWLVFTFMAFGIIPWIVGIITVNDLFGVLRLAKHSDLLVVFLYGLGWGCGAVLYGLALRFAGMALTYAIVMGLTAAIGSFAPLALLHWQEIFTLRGRVIIGAVLLIVLGVVLCAWAGHLKEKALAATEGRRTLATGQRPVLGVVLAILSGIFSPMSNLSFAYGTPLSDLAVDMGTSTLLAPNVIWVIALSAGSAVNVVYCSVLISKARSWGVFSRPSRDYFLGLLMGVLGPASFVLYGMGSSQLGDLGAVIGWPIMASMGILGANLWGTLTGEWRGVGRRPFIVMSLAVALLTVAMFVLGWAESQAGK